MFNIKDTGKKLNKVEQTLTEQYFLNRAILNLAEAIKNTASSDRQEFYHRELEALLRVSDILDKEISKQLCL